MVAGHHRPWGQLRCFTFEFLVGFREAFWIQVPEKSIVGFADHPGQGLEISDVQADARPLDQHFVEVGLDRLALGLFHVITCQTGESGGHHVPRRDGFLGVQVGRRCVKGVDAQRQALAAQRRPDADLRAVEQSAHARRILALGLDGGCVAPKRKAGEVALWIDDQGRNAGERGLFDQRLRHHRLAAAGAAEHGGVTGQDGWIDVHRLVGVTPPPEVHALRLEFPPLPSFFRRGSRRRFHRFWSVFFVTFGR